MSLRDLQNDVNEWWIANFQPGLRSMDENRMSQALGMAEEVGEVCHAVLKGVQGIREGTDEAAVKELVKDGVGDVIIYAMNLCFLYNLNIEDVLEETASKVLKRDWIKEDGTCE